MSRLLTRRIALAMRAYSSRDRLIGALCLLAAAASSANAVENGGPFGPELPAQPYSSAPAVSNECSPDIHGVTVRIDNIYDASAPDDQRYRQLLSRTDSGGQLLEEPFAFASNPFTSLSWALACDGVGGFAVIWSDRTEECLRVRTFAQTGSVSSGEQLLQPDCAGRVDMPLQFDHPGTGQYRVLWQSRILWDVPRDQILFRSLDDDTLGSRPAVLLKRLRVSDGQPWFDRTARMDDEQTALVVWARKLKIRGQLIGLDGERDTEVFRIDLAHESPAVLEGIEDAGDGTMIPRWTSYWQAGPIGRRVAVSIPIPDLPRSVRKFRGPTPPPDIVDPSALVEVDGEEPAGLVIKHRVDAHDVLPLEVCEHGGIVEG